MTGQPLIGRYEHLPNRPRSNEARPLLEKIASQVKPIMVKRGWKVGTLAEFLPSNPALLGNNMNHGQRINLRLRPPGNESTFYEYDQLVLVMLHELTHIVHGPHDASFYKLLSELEEEYYSLKHKGYEGEGFHSRGNRLNGIRVNEYEGRRKGLAAAERRMSRQIAMGRGGVLGGSGHSGKTMREVVAEAAERRIKDDKACRIESDEAEREVLRAQEESIGTGYDVIDLTGSDDDEQLDGDGAGSPPETVSIKTEPGTSGSGSRSGAVQKKLRTGAGGTTPSVSHLPPLSSTHSARARGSNPGPSTKPTPGTKATSSTKPTSRTSLPKPKPATEPRTASHPPAEEWSCSTCTLINPISAAACDACGTSRPKQTRSAAGWYCDFCGHGPNEMGLWGCSACQWVRNWG